MKDLRAGPARLGPSRLFNNGLLEAGFTLLELLVVVVLISIIASMALLSAGLAGPDTKVTRQAQRLAHLIELQCEESVLFGREAGVRLDTTGYAFTWWDGEGWAPRQAREFRSWLLPEPVELEWAPGQWTRGEPGAPQLLCWSSGEMTPFSIALHAGDTRRFRLEGRSDGEVELVGWQGGDAG